MGAELWSDGQLRSITLTTNAFPDDHTPALPDELFLETDDGTRLAGITRQTTGYHAEEWAVRNTHGEMYGEYESFEDAFKHALLIARTEAEN